MFYLGEEISRPQPNVLEKFARAEVTMYGHYTDFGLPRGLRSVTTQCKFAGPAVTVKLPQLDGTAMHYALSYVRSGDVLVIDHSGETDRSCFGGTLAEIAHAKGVAGVVSNGSVNDIAELEALGLPVFSRGVTPHTTRLLGIEGEINVPVSVGGVVVMPGDMIFADEDGVAVIPSQRAEGMIDHVLERQAAVASRQIPTQVAEGSTLASLSGAKDLFEKRLRPEAGRETARV